MTESHLEQLTQGLEAIDGNIKTIDDAIASAEQEKEELNVLIDNNNAAHDQCNEKLQNIYNKKRKKFTKILKKYNLNRKERAKTRKTTFTAFGVNYDYGMLRRLYDKGKVEEEDFHELLKLTHLGNCFGIYNDAIRYTKKRNIKDKRKIHDISLPPLEEAIEELINVGVSKNKLKNLEVVSNQIQKGLDIQKEAIHLLGQKNNLNSKVQRLESEKKTRIKDHQRKKRELTTYQSWLDAYSDPVRMVADAQQGALNFKTNMIRIEHQIENRYNGKIRKLESQIDSLYDMITSHPKYPEIGIAYDVIRSIMKSTPRNKKLKRLFNGSLDRLNCNNTRDLCRARNVIINKISSASPELEIENMRYVLRISGNGAYSRNTEGVCVGLSCFSHDYISLIREKEILYSRLNKLAED